MVACLSSVHKVLGSVTNILKTEKDLSVAFVTGGCVLKEVDEAGPPCCEDIPMCEVRRAGTVACTCNPSTGRRGQKTPWYWPAVQSTQQAPGPSKRLVKTRWVAPEE